MERIKIMANAAKNICAALFWFGAFVSADLTCLLFFEFFVAIF